MAHMRLVRPPLGCIPCASGSPILEEAQIIPMKWTIFEVFTEKERDRCHAC
jgi:hypothetical protein